MVAFVLFEIVFIYQCKSVLIRVIRGKGLPFSPVPISVIRVNQW